jgi:signal transduction histidine kinase
MTHHQLRSPLAAVQSAVAALSFAGALSETQQDLVARAKRRIQDAFDMIRDLLDLAAAQRIEEPASLPPVQLEESLMHVIEAVQERARAKGLELIESVDLDEGRVRAAPADLERIFSNLLDNAIKYTARGSVSIHASRCPEGLEVAVQDTGIGIAKEDLARVFVGFYRSAAAKATGEVGTGLGLSIVQTLVARLGGTLTVDSQPGKGTTFTVHLPAVGPDSPNGGADQGEPSPAAAAH